MLRYLVSLFQEARKEFEEAGEALKQIATRPIGQLIDEAELLKKSEFPIKPKELINLAKEAVKDPFDNFSTKPELVDVENFCLQGPVVGPLSYEQMQAALKGFSISTIFPGFQSCTYNYWVDPYEPSRIVDNPPCMHSFVFNEEGKIVKATVAYVMDRDIGNTGGLGGIFGPLWAIGLALPFPEAKPWKQSWQYKVNIHTYNQITEFYALLKDVQLNAAD